MTTLTEYFTYNDTYPDCRCPASRLETDGCGCHRTCKYQDFPERFRFDKKEKQWVPRQRDTGTIGRLVALHPSKGDVFYLRMLLCQEHCVGARSYDHLRTVTLPDGQRRLLDSYQAVCAHLGLLSDDAEWEAALADAAHTQMPAAIRALFVSILLFCAPCDPLALFTEHSHEMWQDFEHRHSLPATGDNVRLLQAMVLLDIEERLALEGKMADSFQLPAVSETLRAQVSAARVDARLARMPREVRHQLDHDRDHLRAEVDRRLQGVGPSAAGKYRPAQLAFHERVMAAIRDPQIAERCFFLDARGGTGKTYVENGLLADVRLLDENSVALAVAVSGIATTLLAKAATFHSRFKCPLQVDSSTVFNIRRGTKEAQLLTLCRCIIWDEAPMGHRHLLEALDRTLRDICGDGVPTPCPPCVDLTALALIILSAWLADRPFAGKVMVLCGDFRQVLPVVPRASRAGIVGACLNRSLLWPLFTVWHLTENMRVLAHGSDAQLARWDQFLLKLGNGELPTIDDSDYVELQPEQCHSIDNSSDTALKQSQRRLLDLVYPDLQHRCSDATWLAERGILAPKNIAVDEMNETCLGLLPGEDQVFTSADATLDPAQAAEYQPEFLNSLQAQGMPAHRLALKPGVIIMLLRNLSKRDGLCNGTRLIFNQAQGRFLLKCTIAAGEYKGTTVLIPRILTQPSDMRGQPCEWQRLQFPVRLAFAMTINKSQGQTFQRVAVWLEHPVFAHGQLYVAASRVGHPDCIMFAIARADGMPPHATKNVVYREVLNNAA